MKAMIALILISLSLTSFTVNKQNDFEGIWYSKKMNNMSIKIYLSEDGFWYGQIIDSDNKNHVGELILKKLSYNKEANSLTGEIQKPDSKFTANATLILKTRNNLRITATKFFMSRSFDLERL